MTSFQAMCDFVKTMPNVMNTTEVKEQEEQFKEMEELGIVVKEEHELSLMTCLKKYKDNTIKSRLIISL